MKLESLQSSKFEALSENAMQHIVGGQKCATPSGEHDTSGGCAKHSNDYTDGGATVYAEGGDFSATTMSRIPTCLSGGGTIGQPSSGQGSTIGGVTNSFVA